MQGARILLCYVDVENSNVPWEGVSSAIAGGLLPGASALNLPTLAKDLPADLRPPLFAQLVQDGPKGATLSAKLKFIREFCDLLVQRLREPKKASGKTQAGQLADGALRGPYHVVLVSNFDFQAGMARHPPDCGSPASQSTPVGIEKGVEAPRDSSSLQSKTAAPQPVGSRAGKGGLRITVSSGDDAVAVEGQGEPLSSGPTDSREAKAGEQGEPSDLPFDSQLLQLEASEEFALECARQGVCFGAYLRVLEGYEEERAKDPDFLTLLFKLNVTARRIPHTRSSFDGRDLFVTEFADPGAAEAVSRQSLPASDTAAGSSAATASSGPVDSRSCSEQPGPRLTAHLVPMLEVPAAGRVSLLYDAYRHVGKLSAVPAKEEKSFLSKCKDQFTDTAIVSALIRERLLPTLNSLVLLQEGYHDWLSGLSPAFLAEADVGSAEYLRLRETSGARSGLQHLHYVPVPQSLLPEEFAASLPKLGEDKAKAGKKDANAVQELSLVVLEGFYENSLHLLSSTSRLARVLQAARLASLEQRPGSLCDPSIASSVPPGGARDTEAVVSSGPGSGGPVPPGWGDGVPSNGFQSLPVSSIAPDVSAELSLAQLQPAQAVSASSAIRRIRATAAKVASSCSSTSVPILPPYVPGCFSDTLSFFPEVARSPLYNFQADFQANDLLAGLTLECLEGLLPILYPSEDATQPKQQPPASASSSRQDKPKGSDSLQKKGSMVSPDSGLIAEAVAKATASLRQGAVRRVAMAATPSLAELLGSYHEASSYIPDEQGSDVAGIMSSMLAAFEKHDVELVRQQAERAEAIRLEAEAAARTAKGGTRKSIETPRDSSTPQAALPTPSWPLPDPSGYTAQSKFKVDGNDMLLLASTVDTPSVNATSTPDTAEDQIHPSLLKHMFPLLPCQELGTRAPATVKLGEAFDIQVEGRGTSPVPEHDQGPEGLPPHFNPKAWMEDAVPRYSQLLLDSLMLRLAQLAGCPSRVLASLRSGGPSGQFGGLEGREAGIPGENSLPSHDSQGEAEGREMIIDLAADSTSAGSRTRPSTTKTNGDDRPGLDSRDILISLDYPEQSVRFLHSGMTEGHVYQLLLALGDLAADFPRSGSSAIVRFSEDCDHFPAALTFRVIPAASNSFSGSMSDIVKQFEPDYFSLFPILPCFPVWANDQRIRAAVLAHTKAMEEYSERVTTEALAVSSAPASSGTPISAEDAVAAAMQKLPAPRPLAYDILPLPLLRRYRTPSSFAPATRSEVDSVSSSVSVDSSQPVTQAIVLETPVVAKNHSFPPAPTPSAPAPQNDMPLLRYHPSVLEVCPDPGSASTALASRYILETDRPLFPLPDEYVDISPIAGPTQFLLGAPSIQGARCELDPLRFMSAASCAFGTVGVFFVSPGFSGLSEGRLCEDQGAAISVSPPAADGTSGQAVSSANGEIRSQAEDPQEKAGEDGQEAMPEGNSDDHVVLPPIPDLLAALQPGELANACESQQLAQLNPLLAKMVKKPEIFKYSNPEDVGKPSKLLLDTANLPDFGVFVDTLATKFDLLPACLKEYIISIPAGQADVDGNGAQESPEPQDASKSVVVHRLFSLPTSLSAKHIAWSPCQGLVMTSQKGVHRRRTIVGHVEVPATPTPEMTGVEHAPPESSPTMGQTPLRSPLAKSRKGRESNSLQQIEWRKRKRRLTDLQTAVDGEKAEREVAIPGVGVPVLGERAAGSYLTTDIPARGLRVIRTVSVLALFYGQERVAVFVQHRGDAPYRIRICKDFLRVDTEMFPAGASAEPWDALLSSYLSKHAEHVSSALQGLLGTEKCVEATEVPDTGASKPEQPEDTGHADSSSPLASSSPSSHILPAVRLCYTVTKQGVEVTAQPRLCAGDYSEYLGLGPEYDDSTTSGSAAPPPMLIDSFRPRRDGMSGSARLNRQEAGQPTQGARGGTRLAAQVSGSPLDDNDDDGVDEDAPEVIELNGAGTVGLSVAEVPESASTAGSEAMFRNHDGGPQGGSSVAGAPGEQQPSSALTVQPSPSALAPPCRLCFFNSVTFPSDYNAAEILPIPCSGAKAVSTNDSYYVKTINARLLDEEVRTMEYFTAGLDRLLPNLGRDSRYLLHYCEVRPFVSAAQFTDEVGRTSVEKALSGDFRAPEERYTFENSIPSTYTVEAQVLHENPAHLKTSIGEMCREASKLSRREPNLLVLLPIGASFLFDERGEMRASLALQHGSGGSEVTDFVHCHGGVTEALLGGFARLGLGFGEANPKDVYGFELLAPEADLGADIPTGDLEVTFTAQADHAQLPGLSVYKLTGIPGLCVSGHRVILGAPREGHEFRTLGRDPYKFLPDLSEVFRPEETLPACLRHFSPGLQADPNPELTALLSGEAGKLEVGEPEIGKLESGPSKVPGTAVTPHTGSPAELSLFFSLPLVAAHGAEMHLAPELARPPATEEAKAYSMGDTSIATGANDTYEVSLAVSAGDAHRLAPLLLNTGPGRAYRVVLEHVERCLGLIGEHVSNYAPPRFLLAPRLFSFDILYSDGIAEAVEALEAEHAEATESAGPAVEGEAPDSAESAGQVQSGETPAPSLQGPPEVNLTIEPPGEEQWFENRAGEQPGSHHSGQPGNQFDDYGDAQFNGRPSEDAYVTTPSPSAPLISMKVDFLCQNSGAFTCYWDSPEGQAFLNGGEEAYSRHSEEYDALSRAVLGDAALDRLEPPLVQSTHKYIERAMKERTLPRNLGSITGRASRAGEDGRAPEAGTEKPALAADKTASFVAYQTQSPERALSQAPLDSSEITRLATGKLTEAARRTRTAMACRNVSYTQREAQAIRGVTLPLKAQSNRLQGMPARRFEVNPRKLDLGGGLALGDVLEVEVRFKNVGIMPGHIRFGRRETQEWDESGVVRDARVQALAGPVTPGVEVVATVVVQVPLEPGDFEGTAVFKSEEELIALPVFGSADPRSPPRSRGPGSGSSIRSTGFPKVGVVCGEAEEPSD